MRAPDVFGGESETIEYKREIPVKSEKYMKTVVAFANGKGGKLIFGVEDETWDIVGISSDMVFQNIDAITNAVYESCEPKIIPNIVLQESEGKLIIVVEILPGMQRPYYIKKQGIVDGTYIRVAGTTRHAEHYRVQELILDGKNGSFDQLEREETVTETEINAFCERLYRHARDLSKTVRLRDQILPVGKNQLLSWKLLVERNGGFHPTNGYRLLNGDMDDFPDASVQCAVFKGTTRNVFITRKEFDGPIYQQIEDAYNFVLQHIDIGSSIEGVARQDYYELPVHSIREIISNAVCHRSYLTPGKIQVALYDDRLEVTSPGMLDREITVEKMKTGLSRIRNRGIASAFSYMKIIEAWGTGIPRIFHEAKEYGLPEPELLDMGSDFRVNLYRKTAGNTAKELNGATGTEIKKDTNDTKNDTNDTKNDTSNAKNDTKMEKHKRDVLQIVRGNPFVTQQEISNKLGISIATVKRVMKQLQESGRIKRRGSSRTGEWITPDGE